MFTFVTPVSKKPSKRFRNYSWRHNYIDERKFSPMFARSRISSIRIRKKPVVFDRSGDLRWPMEISSLFYLYCLLKKKKFRALWGSSEIRWRVVQRYGRTINVFLQIQPLQFFFCFLSVKKNWISFYFWKYGNENPRIRRNVVTMRITNGLFNKTK